MQYVATSWKFGSARKNVEDWTKLRAPLELSSIMLPALGMEDHVPHQAQRSR